LRIAFFLVYSPPVATRGEEKEKRFRKFVENHPFFTAGVDFDPAKVDVREMIAVRGIPSEWLERIEKDFAASEFQLKVQISLERSVAGSKGRKFGGRGRSKKLKKNS
jgi:hypothetical protein